VWFVAHNRIDGQQLNAAAPEVALSRRTQPAGVAGGREWTAVLTQARAHDGVAGHRAHRRCGGPVVSTYDTCAYTNSNEVHGAVSTASCAGFRVYRTLGSRACYNLIRLIVDSSPLDSPLVLTFSSFV